MLHYILYLSETISKLLSGYPRILLKSRNFFHRFVQNFTGEELIMPPPVMDWQEPKVRDGKNYPRILVEP